MLSLPQQSHPLTPLNEGRPRDITSLNNSYASTPYPPPASSVTDISGKLAVPLKNGRALYDVHVLIFSLPDGQEFVRISITPQPNFWFDGQRILINRDGGGIENVHEHNLADPHRILTLKEFMLKIYRDRQIQSSFAVKQMLSKFRKGSAFPRYEYILTALLLLAAPFLLFPTGYKLLALLILPAIWFIRWRIIGRVIPQTPFDGPILLILIMVLVSIWATFDLSFSIGKIAGLLLGIAIYYAVVDIARTKAALQTITIFFILSGIALAAISILGTQWIYKFPLIEPLLNKLPAVLRGIPGAEQGFHPNQVGGVLIFFIPLQLVLGYYWLKNIFQRPSPPGKTPQVNSFGPGGRKKIDKEELSAIFVGGSLLITVGVLFLTQSRGAIGGLMVGLVTIAAIRTRWGKALAVIGLIVILIAVNAGFVDEMITSGDLETEAIGALSLKSRLELWTRAVEGIVDFPFTGMGMNNFRRVMQNLYPAFSISPTWNFGHAHNHLLQVALDLGIPGLVAYLALWLGTGFLLLQTILQANDQFYQVIALGLIGSFTAYFVYGLTDAVALGAKPGFVFWWALGLAVAAHYLFYQDKLVA